VSNRPKRVFLSADVAHRMREAGLPTCTPGAVRAAVADGRLSPDMISAGDPPVHVWSEMALLRDIEAQTVRQAIKRSLRVQRAIVRGQGELALDPSTTDRGEP